MTSQKRTHLQCWNERLVLHPDQVMRFEIKESTLAVRRWSRTGVAFIAASPLRQKADAKPNSSVETGPDLLERLWNPHRARIMRGEAVRRNVVQTEETR